jgi:hypothetical protein
MLVVVLRNLFGVVLVVVGVGSCKPDADPRRVVLRDEGELCIGAPSPGDSVDVRAGAPLTLGVRSACLSDTCVTARSATCRVRREGQRLVVSSELAWRGPEELDTKCPRDCSFIEATCSTDALGEGTYSVQLGPSATELIVPSRRDKRCGASSASAEPLAAKVTEPLDPTPVTPVTPAPPATGVADASPPPADDVICVGPAVASSDRALRSRRCVRASPWR